MTREPFHFVVSAPSSEREQLTSLLLSAGSDVSVRPIRSKRGVADAVGALVAASPILLQVSANALICVDYLITYVRALPKRRSTQMRVVIGGNTLDLTTSEPSVVKDAIRAFCRDAK